MHIQHALYGLIASASLFGTGAAKKKCRSRTSDISVSATPVASISPSSESHHFSLSDTSSVSATISDLLTESSTTPGTPTPSSALETPTLSSSSTISPDSSSTSIPSPSSALGASTTVASSTIPDASTTPSIPSTTSDATSVSTSAAPTINRFYVYALNSENAYVMYQPIRVALVNEPDSLKPVVFITTSTDFASYTDAVLAIEEETGRLMVAGTNKYLITGVDTSGTATTVYTTTIPTLAGYSFFKCTATAGVPLECQTEGTGVALTFVTETESILPGLRVSTNLAFVQSEYSSVDLIPVAV